MKGKQKSFPFFIEINWLGMHAQKKTARTSQKEEEVGVLPRATEVTGGRRSFQISVASNLLKTAQCQQIQFMVFVNRMQEKKYRT